MQAESGENASLEIAVWESVAFGEQPLEPSPRPLRRLEHEGRRVASPRDGKRAAEEQRCDEKMVPKEIKDQLGHMFLVRKARRGPHKCQLRSVAAPVPLARTD